MDSKGKRIDRVGRSTESFFRATNFPFSKPIKYYFYKEFVGSNLE